MCFFFLSPQCNVIASGHFSLFCIPHDSSALCVLFSLAICETATKLSLSAAAVFSISGNGQCRLVQGAQLEDGISSSERKQQQSRSSETTPFSFSQVSAAATLFYYCREIVSYLTEAEQVHSSLSLCISRDTHDVVINDARRVIWHSERSLLSNARYSVELVYAHNYSFSHPRNFSGHLCADI